MLAPDLLLLLLADHLQDVVLLHQLLLAQLDARVEAGGGQHQVAVLLAALAYVQQVLGEGNVVGPGEVPGECIGDEQLSAARKSEEREMSEGGGNRWDSYRERKKCMSRSMESTGSLYTKTEATVGSQSRKMIGSSRTVLAT